MDLQSLKKRLMSDPDFSDPDIQAAARADRDCADAVESARAFEADLATALKVRAPRGLADRVIARQRQAGGRPEMPWMLATAAALMLSVGVVSFQLLSEPDDGHPELAGHDIWAHLAWHWDYDGARALEVSQTNQTSPNEVRALLDELGLRLAPELLAQVQLGKACPTPDGRGAHLILTTADGPITLMIMPQTQVPLAPASATLDNGLEAWLVNLERGSVAVLAEPGRNAHELARQLQQQVSVNDGLQL